MKRFEGEPIREQELASAKALGDFDMEYFRMIEGENGWIALGRDNCTNQRYFTVLGENNEKLGVIGVYDTAEEKNVTHTVVDPKYRGQGLAAQFKKILISGLDLPFLTMTINLDNEASVRATEKLPGVRKISDEKFEEEFKKAKYIYEPPKEGES
jgi:hypothetical protein